MKEFWLLGQGLNYLRGGHAVYNTRVSETGAKKVAGLSKYLEYSMVEQQEIHFF